MTNRIWPFPCEHCPSMQGDDPEARQIRRAYRRGEISLEDAVFVCAWRQEKLCYGVCLKAKVTEATLVEKGFDLSQEAPVELDLTWAAKRLAKMHEPEVDDVD